MKLVKTRPKYRCDFCENSSTKAVMEKHEKRCFRNPNWYCDACNNSGNVIIRETIWKGTPFLSEATALTKTVNCKHCAKFDRQQLAEIEARESE